MQCQIIAKSRKLIIASGVLGVFAVLSVQAEQAVSSSAAVSSQALSPQTVIGWKLFFDPSLSRNNNVSCASCHDPEKGYGDGLRFSQGTHGDTLTRNSPSVVDLAEAQHFFWDGRAGSLEEQAEGPITNPLEMDLTLEEVVQRVSAKPEYRTAFKKIGVEDIGISDVTAAIAAFERNLTTGPSAYDRWLQGEADALSKSQRNGRFLFFTRGQCAICHIGQTFSDHNFHNIGTGSGDDLGRYEITKEEKDKGMFKTPSLKNWKGKQPFMHDGRFATMAEVIAFYTDPPPPTVGESELDPLRFSERDQQDLLAFMEALNGDWPDLSVYPRAWKDLIAK